MVSTIIICVTCIICVYIASHASVCIAHKDDTYKPQEGEGITQEMLDAAIAEANRDPEPSFEDVISVINKEFGGVDYEG